MVFNTIEDAIYGGSVEDVDRFLSSGVDVNTTNETGRTLLMLAIDNCFDTYEMKYRTDIINLLISKNANINAKDEDGETAMFRAILTSVEIIDSLVQAKANVNEVDNKGDTPLIRCMTFNIDADKIDRLIAHGADLYYENTENGNTPMLEAAGMGRFEILKHFFPKIHDINATNATGDTLLMSAARFHDIHTLKLIIDAKPNINLQDKDGRTALMWAVFRESCTNANILLENGADLKLKDNDGKTAVDLAYQIEDDSIRNEMIHILKKYQDAPLVKNPQKEATPVLAKVPVQETTKEPAPAKVLTQETAKVPSLSKVSAKESVPILAKVSPQETTKKPDPVKVSAQVPVQKKQRVIIVKITYKY